MASAENDSPKRRKKRKHADTGGGLWNHALLAVGVSAAGLVFAVAILWFQLVESSNEAFYDRQITTLTNQYAGYFNSRIASLEAEIQAVARAPQTVAALVSYDEAAMMRTGEALQQIMGFSRRVSIIPKGQGEVDLNAAVPISWAALDVIRRAEDQPFVGPEIALNQRNLVYAAAPIVHEGINSGVLFVALSTDYFFEPIKSFDADQGQVRILQSFEGSPAEKVFVFGLGDTPDAAVSAPLRSTNWRLEFEPNLENIVPVASLANLLAAIAVIASFVLAGVSLAFSGLSRKLNADADELAEYASRLLRGRSPSGRFQLDVFKDLATSLSQYAGKGDGSGKATKRRAATREFDDGEDALVVDDLLADDDPPKRPVGDLVLNDEPDDNFGIEVSEEVSPVDMGLDLDGEIFRAYDIRGITTKNLTEDVVYWIGRAFAAECQARSQARVAVGRDGRHSSGMLRDALNRGLTEGGVDVLDVGEVPTPVLYFATHSLNTGTGIMITGSHNPPEYNGLKMMIAGETLAEARIQALKTRLEENELTEGEGDIESVDLDDHYLDRIVEDVVVAQPMKVVIDCGNGVAGKIAPRLIEELGCEVVPLYCDVDGDFPNHHPDPAEPENLQDLITVVKDERAQLGLAFDGDGDRLGVVTASGDIIWPDKLMMLFAQDVVGRNPGADILYDVKCSRHLNTIISELGGRPIMWKTGHSHMKAKMKETGALLAGEFSGHICFGERWYGFDDALYSAARLLEILGAQDKTADEVFGQFPITYSTPEIKIQTTDAAKFKIMAELEVKADFGDGTRTTIDGLRVDYADGWGLIRPSNTSPVLSLRFEADGQTALERIQDIFQSQLSRIDGKLRFR